MQTLSNISTHYSSQIKYIFLDYCYYFDSHYYFKNYRHEFRWKKKNNTIKKKYNKNKENKTISIYNINVNKVTKK